MKFLLVGVLLLAQAPQGSVERGKKLYQESGAIPATARSARAASAAPGRRSRPILSPTKRSRCRRAARAPTCRVTRSKS